MDYAFDLPFPSLARQRGEADTEYFLQPAATYSVSAGRLVTSHTVEDAEVESQIPTNFGTLYPVYYKPRSNDTLESELVFVRRNKGTLQHGVQREDAAAYEKAKFNVLLYPGNGMKNNINYGKDDIWTSMDPKWQSMLRLYTWPRVFRAPTIVSRERYPC